MGYRRRKLAFFDTQSFLLMLDVHRETSGFNWKQVAAATGVSGSVFSNMRKGEGLDLHSMAALAEWANLDVNDFVVLDEQFKKPEKS